MQSDNARLDRSYNGSMENYKENSFGIEIPPKATRRVIAPSYKARILKEYDSLDTNGRGALLRREGLYLSHIPSLPRLLSSSLIYVYKRAKTEPN